jgi:ankyrin repeat protein
MDALMLAVDCEFSLETLEFISKQEDFDANLEDHSGRTALHYAVDLDNAEIVRFLLKHGADPNKED